MQTFNAQQGLLVCWGGFKKTVLTEARTGHFSIRLWDSGKLVEAIYRTYEQLTPQRSRPSYLSSKSGCLSSRESES